MPKSHKDLLKQQIAHSYYNIDQAAEHITNVLLAFAPVHPELTKPLLACLQGIVTLEEVLKVFVRDTWGITDPDWHSWRNFPEK
jgi:hypothetical protein